MAFLYIQIEKIWPNSFLFLNDEAITGVLKDDAPSRLSNFLYYSFVTISTLGFGDIAPMRPVARAFSVLQAIFGQLYLAILIARVIGIQISQSQKDFIEETRSFYLPKK